MLYEILQSGSLAENKRSLDRISKKSENGMLSQSYVSNISPNMVMLFEPKKLTTLIIP